MRDEEHSFLRSYIKDGQSVAEKTFCRKSAGDIRLLLLVKSASAHADRRKLARETWATFAGDMPGVDFVFFVGRDDDGAEA